MNELSRLLADGPVFCFGSDLDWNSDAVLRNYLSVMKEHGGRTTVFATHKTDVLNGFKDMAQVAIHPNFLPGSSHGKTFDEVIEHCFAMYPETDTFRSHSYFDNQIITEKMAARGIRYDANLCLYRQAGSAPMRHCHIDMRIPSWLDDNIHWYHGGSWKLGDLKMELETPGLKVINFHPPTVALNLSTYESYNHLRALIPTMDAAAIATNTVSGVGPRTFLIELLEWINGRYRTMQFHEIYQMGTREARMSLGSCDSGADVAGRPAIDVDYRALSEQERMLTVREQYNSMSAKGRYATSRDYNNREIELDVILDSANASNILDLGCGNGYTALTLGSRTNAKRIIGVDFSENMIEGAKQLMMTEFDAGLTVKPEFVCANVFDYVAQMKPGEFDFVITERLVVNLPTPESQFRLIGEILDKLKPGGRLLLVEGSMQGFALLNEIRAKCGLDVIPDRYAGNESSNKLDAAAIQSFADVRMDVRMRELRAFTFYSLASKVLHPLIVKPEMPKFASVVNDRARDVQQAINELDIALPAIGAAAAWLFEKI